MPSAWWTHFPAGLAHHVVIPRSADQVIVITNILIDLGYTCTSIRLKNSPVITIFVMVIQQEHNPEEAQLGQKYYPMCGLPIWEVPQDSMDDQRQTLIWFNQ